MKRDGQAPEFPQEIRNAKRGDLVLLLHALQCVAFLGKFERRTTFKNKPIVWLDPAYKIEPPQQMHKDFSLPRCELWQYGIYATKHSTYYKKEEVEKALDSIPWLRPYASFIQSWREQKRAR